MIYAFKQFLLSDFTGLLQPGKTLPSLVNLDWSTRWMCWWHPKVGAVLYEGLWLGEATAGVLRLRV